ncbi:uncharacterized protein Bfra_003482 [Botrytis fragariae]|uniref:Uncharacterized protein n=1 Tax=Botrytis fragariae TaxID=1964551 RepID=A0A8H6AWY1_9HELO|nr:uncharacterized protein Bfra_003482 [Botrytis fragariae]KAF5875029.1 hypothetical protein Bfra_003482 [Botrytis fragariae]
MFLNLMRQLANILVQLALQLFWATSSVKALLFESLLMTRFIEMAGSLILHPPQENEQAIKKFSITLFFGALGILACIHDWGVYSDDFGKCRRPLCILCEPRYKYPDRHWRIILYNDACFGVDSW